MKRIFVGLTCALICILSQQASAQNAIVIDSGSTWKYWANTQANAPSATWNGSGAFDDSGWPSGVAKLGFGQDGEVTQVPAGCGTLGNPGSCGPKYMTTYFRKNFTLSHKGAYTGFIVRLLRDDGAVVYVNGVEVWRSNMPTGTVSYTTAATAAVGNNDEYTFYESPVIPTTAFNTGNNIISVEVHQSGNTSSDLGFNLQLVGQLTAGNTLMPLGSVWKYWANTEANAPGIAWTGSAAFDDSGWPSGPGRLGFGQDGEVTLIPAGCGTLGNPGNCTPKFNTTYFRTTVNITNSSNYNGFFINMTRDDGAVVYVNGVEVWRTGMPTGLISYSTFALLDPQAQSDGPNETALFSSPSIPASAFINGVNTIAVEVHQLNDNSSDLGFDMQLVGQPKQSDILQDYGGTWKYWSNTQANAPSTTWNGSGAFDDSGWPSGVAKLGFGGDGEVTAIPAGCGTLGSPGNCTPKFNTIYFRKTVNIANVNNYVGFTIDMIRDDGAIVYVNGQEVWRSNMPSGAIDYNTFASSIVDNANETATFTSPVIPASYFQNGVNTIAVEVHQINATSSDLGMDLRLKGLYVIPANEVVYMWSGALTSTSAKVNAKLTSATTQARLVVSTNSSLSSPIYGPYATADAANNLMAAMSISGLVPNTKYYYAIQTDGVTDASSDDIGSFTTPASSAFNFKFAVGGCAATSNHPVYNKIGEKNPLLFVSLGDFHYANPNSSTDINVHRLPYEQNMLSQTPSRNFFLNTPLAYMWDDHDYSGNDTDSTAAGKTNARLAYQEYVPHYPLSRGTGNVPIYQAFTIGRVHFIMTDLRSTRHQSSGVIWDATQKQWFKDQCLYAKNNNLTIAWVNTISFGGNQADNWGGFAAERTDISNFFRDNNIQHMFILSGDAHMLAMDNGANHDFSTGSNNSFDYPVFAAAALNQGGSVKGCTYNVKPDGSVDMTPGASYTYPNPNNTFGQYGIVEVNDNGIQLCITFTGYRVTNTGTETVLSTYSFCRAAGGSLPIKLSYFNAKPVANEKVQLDWEVSEQTDCKEYVVERSVDGVNFNSLLTVNCQTSNRYTSFDAVPVKGANFYRIKMIETDGSYTYSPTRKVTFAAKGKLLITPNPVVGDLKFRVSHGNATRSLYSIFDITGKKYTEGMINVSAGLNSIQLPKLTKGTYLFRINIDGVDLQETFIIQ